jgi:hypothetical protein
VIGVEPLAFNVRLYREGSHGLLALTPYVPRAHDHRLIDLIATAGTGASAIDGIDIRNTTSTFTITVNP